VGGGVVNQPKITLVGAGGLSFGPTMVNDVIHTPALAGSRLVLHDVDEKRLLRAYRFAARLNAANGSPVVLDHFTDPAAAFDGADFCISSAEFGRFSYWRQDYEIPRRHGATQINGENGGPGAVFHSLRSIKNTLSICASIETHCPDAFLVNLSNPMSRVTLAINAGTNVRNVGMCHEMPIGIVRLARLLRMRPSHIAAKASGINHFTFFTEMVDTETGEDLLPSVRALFARKIFDFGPWLTRLAAATERRPVLAMLADQLFSPLVAHMVRTYGLVPCSVDSHIGEYLPFAQEIGGHHPAHVDQFARIDKVVERLTTWAAETRLPLPFHRMGHSLEEVVPIIAALWTGAPRRVVAVNVPNRGYLPNVSEGAIVEVGAEVDGDGIHPDVMPPIEEPIAGHIATQIRLQDLIVRSALTADRELALQAVIEDPTSPHDEAPCRAMFDEMLRLQADELPF
jgi:alpha-galactosidase/6-phospho-beta-glucosidase family protein